MHISASIFESIDAMLAPEVLSALLSVRVRAVTRQPLEVAHRSANAHYEILLETDAGRSRLILKEFQPQRDWVMRLTHDTFTREAMLFVHGIYAQMPAQIIVPMIAVARHGGTWATLLHDISSELLPSDRMLLPDDARFLLENLAALHAHFWNDRNLENNALGLSSLEDFVTILSPARVKEEIRAGRDHPVLEMAVRGWVRFEQTAPKDVVKVVGALQEKPTLMLDILEKMPPTLLHGDFKLGNLGIYATGETIALDWQDATRGAGVLDLGYFVTLNAQWLPFGKTEALEIYRQAMQAYGHSISMGDIELGLIVGGALRLMWLMILNDNRDLAWWYDLICRNAR